MFNAISILRRAFILRKLGAPRLIITFGINPILWGIIARFLLRAQQLSSLRGYIVIRRLMYERHKSPLAKLKDRIVVFFERCALRLSQRVIVLNGYHRRLLIERHRLNAENQSRLLVVPNNTPTLPSFPSRKPQSRTISEPYSLLYIGELVRRKGILTLLNACELLKTENFPFHLDVVGYGAFDHVAEEFCRGHSLVDKVTFHGWQEKPLHFMKDADLLVVPSHIDTFPNVVLEALVVGLPVIGSDIPGILDELVFPELLFRPDDPASLVERVGEIFNKKGAYKKALELCAERRDSLDFDWIAAFELVIADCVR